MPEEKRPRDKYVGSVRQSDVEPYTALKWLGTLFKAAAVFSPRRLVVPGFEA